MRNIPNHKTYKLTKQQAHKPQPHEPTNRFPKTLAQRHARKRLNPPHHWGQGVSSSNSRTSFPSPFHNYSGKFCPNSNAKFLKPFPKNPFPNYFAKLFPAIWAFISVALFVAYVFTHQIDSQCTFGSLAAPFSRFYNIKHLDLEAFLVPFWHTGGSFWHHFSHTRFGMDV